MRKPNKFYIVSIVKPWGNVDRKELQRKGHGYCPVFTNKREAEKAFPGMELIAVDAVKDYKPKQLLR